MIRRCAAGAALAILLTSAADAQTVGVQPPAASPPQAPRLQTPQVSLADAVRLTVENNVSVARSRQTLQLVVGRAQETRGLFDPLFRITPSAIFSEQQLAPFLRKSEHDKREIITAIGDEFTLLTTALNRIVANSSTTPPRCPADLTLTFGGFNFTNTYLSSPINVDRLDPSELTLLGTQQFLPGTPFNDLLGGITLGNLCTNPAVVSLSPENFIDIFKEIAPKIDQSGGLGLQGVLTSVSQIPRESRALQAQISHAIATRARLAIERLGPLPIDQFQRSFLADISLYKPFRTGIAITPAISLQMQDQNFRDKPYDSSFGGMGVPPNFVADASLTLNVPVGRGSGRTAVAAPERAAAFIVSGQREAVRHEISQQVYRTSLAYFNLIAAQETLSRLQESAARQQQLADLTDRAVTAGDLPRVEVDRARARAERVNSAVSDARTAVVNARVSLADTMGVSADTLDATPIATETFATTTPRLEAADALVARALASRLDVRASQAQVSASETLASGARADLRRTFDFLVTGGLSNLYDSPTYKYLPDEVNPIIPPSDPLPPAIHYYSPRGFYRAIRGRWEPYVVAQLNISFPFGNRAAKGRFQQAQATATASRIEVEDLTRHIRANVTDVLAQLERSAASLQQWQAAVRADDDILQAAMQRFQARDQTLVDTLLTEEAVTSDRLELVRQRQIYYSTLARLQFETGGLVGFDPADPNAATVRFDPGMFVSR